MNARPWLELVRLSNAPTVATNVLTGVAIGLASFSADHETNRSLAIDLPLLIAAMLAMYAGGMALNDALDRETDARERPSRPIPSGRITPRAAFTLAALLLGVGPLLIARHGVVPLVFALALLSAIILYNMLHARWAGSVMLMGACRALVVITSATAIAWPARWVLLGPLAFMVFAYIIALSLVARHEAQPQPRARFLLGWLLPFFALLPIAVVRPDAWTPWPIVIGALLLVWLVTSFRHLRALPPAVPRAVMAWIAALALMDALVLSLLDEPGLALLAVGCFLLTISGHRRIAGS